MTVRLARPAMLFCALGFWACFGLACSDSSRVRECLSEVDCTGALEPPNDCQKVVCLDGQCILGPREEGLSCITSRPLGPCESAACDGQGACRIGALADGSPCDDGLACTRDDICSAGSCAGVEVVCPPPQTCRLLGVCAPESGLCSDPQAPDGAVCDDGDPDTRADSCVAGLCTGLSPVDCPDLPACDLAPPDPGPEQDWRHTSSSIIAALGSSYHRGRDLFVTPQEEQWAIGKFAYGLLADKDIHDEDVDIYLLRDCSAWEYLGRATTTDDGQHPTVFGVEDTGGRVYFQIPAEKRLGVGRHRIHFVVLGDLSRANQYIQVLPPDSHAIVTDIDGTLTTSEYAQAWDTLLSISPDAHLGAAEALWALARKGYFIFYLTARPEFLGERTQTWLAEKGFPPGISHTTLSHTGASGADAITYKLAELSDLWTKLGRAPDYGFGNKDSDVEAFMQAGMEPGACYYYELDGDPLGGTIHSDYQALASEFYLTTSLCFE